jgi:DNA adenine methylase
MKIPHPIPYQGSKRNLAKWILPFFPHEIQTLFEPFSGSAAISIAAAFHGKSSCFHLNDVNKPLMALWNEIINNPSDISTKYEHLWLEQQGNERQYYNIVRDHFNQTKRPDSLLYLLARCVKASVRYNATGDFNQSPDNRRLGRHPQQMKEDILAVSTLLQHKTTLTSADYKEALAVATSKDLVYLDPPYQGVCATGAPRYVSGIDFDEFMQELKKLHDKDVPFILSYDGRTGKKRYGRKLPDEFGRYRFEIDAGRSTQATLLGRNEVTYESVYLSNSLVEKLHFVPTEVISNHVVRQSVLFEF